MGRARTLAQVYRHFGEVDAAETSPLYERVAVALSESDEALRAIEALPARKRQPALILAALTLYDMIKAVDPGARIDDIRVLRKEGGKTGPWTR